jgi:GAF domain-containing protein
MLCGEPVVVADVTASPVFRDPETLQAVLDANCRAVVSVPLLDVTGQPLAMLSTHYRRPGEPSEHQLRTFVLIARQTACWLARRDPPGG